MKICGKCGGSEFYDSYPSRCRACSRSRSMNWRARNPEKRKAHIDVARALKAGHLIRPNACSKCGTLGIPIAHHGDYDQPLLVIWLCDKCHSAEHRMAA
jgi:ribosomal protein S27AE